MQLFTKILPGQRIFLPRRTTPGIISGNLATERRLKMYTIASDELLSKAGESTLPSLRRKAYNASDSLKSAMTITKNKDGKLPFFARSELKESIATALQTLRAIVNQSPTGLG